MTEDTKPPEALCALLEGALKAPLPVRARSLIWKHLAHASSRLATRENFDNRTRLAAQIRKIENEVSKLQSILQKFDDADFIETIRSTTDEIGVQLKSLHEIAEPQLPPHLDRYASWAILLMRMKDVFENVTGRRSTASWNAHKDEPTGDFARMMNILRPYLPPQLQRQSAEAFTQEVKNCLSLLRQPIGSRARNFRHKST